ncbi:MAG: TetR/AcrR family transcriptional regulator [Eubacteriales bacterium]|nr:TetR/AcrR family transcriptional regulator [Eubacteriales bacterium]
MAAQGTTNATGVFHRLPLEKQEQIYAAAAAEFAAHGYEKANTNVIAKRAGVSVGSLFQYFRTKNDLFLALVDHGTTALLAPVVEQAKEAEDIFSLFRLMLCRARDFALQYPDYNRIYLSLSTLIGEPGPTTVARRVESMTIACYNRALRRSKEQGVIPENVDEGLLGFLLDSIVLMYQFSFASEYYKARLIAYTHLDPGADDDRLIDELCSMLQSIWGR